jgi:hypothetical protein
MSCPAWRTSRPGTAISRHRRVSIIALPPQDAVTGQDGLAAGGGGELVQPAGHAGREQRAPHPGGIDLGISAGEMPEGGSVLAVTEDALDGGAVPVPVLGRGCLARRGHVQVRQDERVGVDRAGVFQPGDRQGALDGVQGPAPPRPGVGGNLARVQPGPADQQGGVRRSPVRPVISHRDLGIVHVSRVAPAVIRIESDAYRRPHRPATSADARHRLAPAEEAASRKSRLG